MPKRIPETVPDLHATKRRRYPVGRRSSTRSTGCWRSTGREYLQENQGSGSTTAVYEWGKWVSISNLISGNNFLIIIFAHILQTIAFIVQINLILVLGPHSTKPSFDGQGSDAKEIQQGVRWYRANAVSLIIIYTYIVLALSVYFSLPPSLALALFLSLSLSLSLCVFNKSPVNTP